MGGLDGRLVQIVGVRRKRERVSKMVVAKSPKIGKLGEGGGLGKVRIRTSSDQFHG